MILNLTSEEVSMIVGMCIAFREKSSQFTPERDILDRILSKIFAEDKRVVDAVLDTPAPLDPATSSSRSGTQFTSSSLEGGTWTRSTKD